MNEMTAYVTAFVEQLAHMGVRQVVISPGSRSTPLAMVMAEHPTLNIHVHIDERSAAFFALGMAKASGEPVALVCTSGTNLSANVSFFNIASYDSIIHRFSCIPVRNG